MFKVWKLKQFVFFLRNLNILASTRILYGTRNSAWDTIFFSTKNNIQRSLFNDDMQRHLRIVWMQKINCETWLDGFRSGFNWRRHFPNSCFESLVRIRCTFGASPILWPDLARPCCHTWSEEACKSRSLFNSLYQEEAAGALKLAWNEPKIYGTTTRTLSHTGGQGTGRVFSTNETEEEFIVGINRALVFHVPSNVLSLSLSLLRLCCLSLSRSPSEMSQNSMNRLRLCFPVLQNLYSRASRQY